jgi:hypothetical protein
MEVPNDPGAGNVMVDPAAVGPLWRSAVHHAAMVYKRLLDADSQVAADDLDEHFTRWFG